MKIRQLIELIQDLHGVADWQGDGLLMAGVKHGVEGAGAFAGIFDELRKKGFSQRDAIEGALNGAEHLVELMARGTPTPAAVVPITSTESAKAEGMAIAQHKLSESRVYPRPATEAFYESQIAATRAALEPKLAIPPKPTFEDSLSDHEKKCPLCREQALKKWNEARGVR